MKIIAKILLLFISISVVSSCADREDESNVAFQQEDTLKDIVFQERNPKLPEVRTRAFAGKSQPFTRSMSFNEVNANKGLLLGYSYKVGSSILGDPGNVGSQVIDVSRISGNDTSNVSAIHIGASSTNSFSYANYDDFISKSQYTKKTSSGFGINIFNIIKIGRKHKNTYLFASYIRDSLKSVFGQADIAYYNSKFTLNTAPSSLRTYITKYLSTSFLQNLYGSTAGNILDSYGDFLLTGYLTGGRATALFAGQAAYSASVTEREKMMDKSINASIDIKFGKDSTASFNLDSLRIGKNEGHVSGSIHYLDECYASVYTYGGRHGVEAVDKPLDLKKTGIDLSPWAKSLDDYTTHTLMDITDGGLLPIGEIVLEDNYKKRLKYTSEGLLAKLGEVLTPNIEITRHYVRYSSSLNKPLYAIAGVINSRQGDKIILADPNQQNLSDAELAKNSDNTYFFKKASEIASKLKSVFEIEIKTNVYGKINPDIIDPLCEVVTTDFNNLYWCKSKIDGLNYIYDKTNKIAFSIYNDSNDGDYVLDDYGIRDWFESQCKYKSFNTGTITRSYKIIGL